MAYIDDVLFAGGVVETSSNTKGSPIDWHLLVQLYEGGSTIGSDDGRDEDDTGAKREDLVPLRLIKPHGCAERAVCSVE